MTTALPRTSRPERSFRHYWIVREKKRPVVLGGYLSVRCACVRHSIRPCAVGCFFVEVCCVYDHHSLRPSIPHPDQSRTGLVRFLSKLTGVRSTNRATEPCEVYEWPSRWSADRRD